MAARSNKIKLSGDLAQLLAAVSAGEGEASIVTRIGSTPWRLLKCLADCQVRHGALINVTQLSAQAKTSDISAANVRYTLDAFSEAGACQKIRTPEGFYLYRFGDPLSIISALTQRGRDKDSAKQANQQMRQTRIAERMSLIASDAQMLAPVNGPSVYRRLWNGILDGALPMTTKARIREREGSYPIYDRNGTQTMQIRVEARSSEQSYIMSGEDLCVILALNSMFVGYVEGAMQSGRKPDQIRNLFVFDIVDLCRETGMDTGANGRQQMVNKLRRIRDTRFTINFEMAQRLRADLGVPATIQEFEYLTGFGYATEEVIDTVVRNEQTDMLNILQSDSFFHGEHAEADADITHFYDVQHERMVARVPRFYYVSFDGRMFEDLIFNRKDHRFIAHPALRQERDGLASRFVSWARGYIGVRPKPKDARADVPTFHLYEFRDLLYPLEKQTPLHPFHAKLKQIVDHFQITETGIKQPFQGDGNNVACLYGYYLEVDYRADVVEEFCENVQRWRPRGKGANQQYPIVRVYRDVHDEFVGNDSAHNRALHRESQAALSSP